MIFGREPCWKFRVGFLPMISCWSFTRHGKSHKVFIDDYPVWNALPYCNDRWGGTLHHTHHFHGAFDILTGENHEDKRNQLINPTVIMLIPPLSTTAKYVFALADYNWMSLMSKTWRSDSSVTGWLDVGEEQADIRLPLLVVIIYFTIRSRKTTLESDSPWLIRINSAEVMWW